MRKSGKQLHLAKETIRHMLSSELQRVVGGGGSCGGDSACNCSTYGDSAACLIGTNQGSLYCTLAQY